MCGARVVCSMNYKNRERKKIERKKEIEKIIKYVLITINIEK